MGNTLISREQVIAGLSEKQKEMLDMKASYMELRLEAGPVVRVRGAAAHRTAYSLEAKGLIKTFTLCPYEGTFFRLI